MTTSSKVICLILVILILMTVFVTLLDAETLDEKSFSFLVSMTKGEQLAFMQGFTLGAYAALTAANHMYGLPPDLALSLMFLDIAPSKLLEETLRWYSITTNFQVPIYVAIYRREYK